VPRDRLSNRRARHPWTFVLRFTEA